MFNFQGTKMSEETKVQTPADNLLDDGNTGLILASDAKSMALWDDPKKREFKETFEQRAQCAEFILHRTASRITELAMTRKFISRKHLSRIRQISYTFHNGYYPSRGGAWVEPLNFGGRSQDDMRAVANERAEAILKNLPSLRKAVAVIDTTTAKNMDRLAIVKERLQAVKDELDDLSEVIDLRQMDPALTIGQLLKQVDDVRDNKEKLTKEFEKLGRESQALDDAISKALYTGIPGLSDAIIKIVNDHYERITALQNMTRRVGERILFGDSPEALELLAHFEQDELTVSASIQKEFAKALEVLNLSKKQIAAPKKKKKA
jgi:hypothetical protein